MIVCNSCLQELLVDVRDKILFEPEYAGNLKEKIPPRSSLLLPWCWLPGALCLLQEVNLLVFLAEILPLGISGCLRVNFVLMRVKQVKACIS